MRFFDPESRPESGWRARVYSVIFDTETPAGKVFDALLLFAILVSVVVISLETVTYFEQGHRDTLRTIEWVLTGLFTVEYVLRLVVVHQPKRYALSFMGMVDLISLLPTYLSLVFASTQALQIIRALRLLRVFRVFQLGQMANEGGSMFKALVNSRYKIAVFFGTTLIIVVIQGALLYYVEHRVNDDFSSIPRAVYWAIVTMTTVGYGDISPVTVPGQAIASMLMLLGYGIIAVPTGIVSAEVAISELSSRAEFNHTKAEEPGLGPESQLQLQFQPQPEPMPDDRCLDYPPMNVWVTGATHTQRGVAASASQPERAPKPS